MSVMDNLRWVEGAAQACQLGGCQATKAMGLIATAERIGTMAQIFDSEDIALWCGVGGHSFSSMDPGRQKVTVQQWDEDAREERPVRVSACGDHARPLSIKTRPKIAITANGSVTDPEVARERGYDPDYVAWLEAKAAEPIGEPGVASP